MQHLVYPPEVAGEYAIGAPLLHDRPITLGVDRRVDSGYSWVTLEQVRGNTGPVILPQRT